MTDDRAKPTHRNGWAFPRLFPLAVGVVAALAALRYVPDLLGFTLFAFGDQGWPLAVDALLDDGLVPTRDFGYFYGLLALALDRAWFAVAGRTPVAVAALIGVGCAGVAVGLVRFAHAARLGRGAKVLFVCAVPVAVMPLPYPTPVHAVEAALLVNALAFQARGRISLALVLVTLAVFVKPGLGYVHGLALVLLVVAGCGGAGGTWRQRAKLLLPAAAVGLAVAAGLAAWVGWRPLAETLFPAGAARNYGDEKFGFFTGDGRRFWLPELFHPLHYLFTPAGFWLVASVGLVGGAVVRLRRLRDPVAATVVTCAALHAAFVLVLFGNQWSWLYYSAVLVCGLCAVVPDRRAVVPVALAALALVGQRGPTEFALARWRSWERSGATAGLFARPDEAVAWRVVREIGRHNRVLVFANTGGARVVFPEVDAPRVWFLLRSTATPAEIDRVRGQLRAADWLVLPYQGDQPVYPDWPEFAAELKAFREAGKAPSFRVFRRAVERPAGGT